MTTIAASATSSASGADTPALMRMPKMVAPATIWAISDRSSPREMMTIAMPQLSTASEAELDRMTRKLPIVANPSTVTLKMRIRASVATATTSSSMFFLPVPRRGIGGEPTAWVALPEFIARKPSRREPKRWRESVPAECACVVNRDGVRTVSSPSQRSAGIPAAVCTSPALAAPCLPSGLHRRLGPRHGGFLRMPPPFQC